MRTNEPHNSDLSLDATVSDRRVANGMTEVIMVTFACMFKAANAKVVHAVKSIVALPAKG